MSARNTLIIKEDVNSCYSIIQQCDDYNILFKSLDLLQVANKNKSIKDLVNLSNNMSVRQKPNYYQKDFLENIWIIDLYNHSFYTIEDKNNLFNFNLLSFKALSLFYNFNAILLESWVFNDIIQDVLIEKSGSQYSILKDKNSSDIWFFINQVMNGYNTINCNNKKLSLYNMAFDLKYIDIPKIKIKINFNGYLKDWDIKHSKLNKLSSIFFLYKKLLVKNISPELTEINWYLKTEKFYRKEGSFYPDDRYEDAKLFFKYLPKKIEKNKIKQSYRYNFDKYNKKIL